MLTKEEQDYVKANANLDVVTQELEELDKNWSLAYTQYKDSKILLDKKASLENELKNLISQVGEELKNPEEDELEEKVELKAKTLDVLKKEVYSVERSYNYVVSALRLYREAQSKLSSAKNYSDWDTFLGGGAIVDSMKRSRMGDANGLVLRGNQELRRVPDNLKTLGYTHSAPVEQSSYWSDTFFDGLWTDMQARDKINGSINSVDNAMKEAQKMKGKLDTAKRELKIKYATQEEEYLGLEKGLENIRIKLIENFMLNNEYNKY